MSHLWEMSAINEPIDFYHGEKVGVGLCLATAVYKKAEQKLRAKRLSGEGSHGAGNGIHQSQYHQSCPAGGDSERKTHPICWRISQGTC